MKKFAALMIALILALSCFAVAEEESYTIGIAQFAEHGSLDNCREGFLAGLAEEGIVEGENLTVEYQNAQADTSMATTIASNFVANGYDLICAIATPIAVCAYNAAEDEIPVIYTAVSAPEEAGLTDGGNVTGTSDELPVAKQLETIRAMLPDAKNIGILYTVGEANSLVQLESYKELAGEYGFTIVESGVTTGADIALALPQLLPQVDCLTMLTDNTVVQYLEVVLDETDAAGIPVFGSEIEQVTLGCVAAEGLDYVALGVQTGKMAAKVLKGEAEAADIPYETIEESALYVNTDACEALGVTIPEDLMARATDMADAEYRSHCPARDASRAGRPPEERDGRMKRCADELCQRPAQHAGAGAHLRPAGHGRTHHLYHSGLS